MLAKGRVPGQHGELLVTLVGGEQGRNLGEEGGKGQAGQGERSSLPPGGGSPSREDGAAPRQVQQHPWGATRCPISPQITQGKEQAHVLPHRRQRGAEEEEEEEGCCSPWLGNFPFLVPYNDGWGRGWEGKAGWRRRGAHMETSQRVAGC